MNDEFTNLKKEIHNNNRFLNINQLESILNKYKSISSNSNAFYYVANSIMPVKVGNLKIGEDTLILNMNHPLNSYCSKKRYCNLCSKCYAKKSSNTYINSCLYNIAAEINFMKLPADKIISDMEAVILNNKTPIKFIRFNEAGDFISYKHFEKANKIATYFKNKYNIISYSYTHNIELEKYITEINNSNIVINYSYDIKTDIPVKKCIVINEQEIKNYVNDPNYIICTGSCTNCGYCKNQSDKRIVIFLDHSKKSINKMLQDNLNKSDLIKLESKKLIDYGNFLLDTIK